MKRLGISILVVIMMMVAITVIRTDERTYVTYTERYETMDPYGDGTAVKEVRWHGSYKKEFNVVKDRVATFRRIGHSKLRFEN